MTRQSIATLPVNALWWCQFEAPTGELRHHGVPAVHLAPRVFLHHLTWPAQWINGEVAETRAQHDQVLIVDRYLNVLPLVAVDVHTARAAGEDWFARIMGRRTNPGDFPLGGAHRRHERSAPRRFDPNDPAQALDWATEFVDRTPRARLITEVPWPEGLAKTPYHPR